LAGLGSRVFLLNNVHEDAPELFQTRWTLSFLRGPLTRTQIKTLMDPVKRQSSMVNRQSGGDVREETSSSRMTNDKLRMTASRPMLPPDVPQHFVPVRGGQPRGSTLIYQPMLLGSSQIRFADNRAGIDVTEAFTAFAPITDGAVAVDWDHAVEAALAVADLERSPADGAQFATLPSAGGKSKNYETWTKDFSGWLFRNQKVDLFRSPSTKEVSKAGESERDFRVRLQQSGREQRDKQSESLRQKYAPKVAALQERKRRAEQAKEREAEQATQSKIQTAVAFGATLLEAFTGRKAIKTSTIGKATTAIRGASRAMKDVKDVGMAEENIAAIDRQIADLNAQFQTETHALLAATDPLTEKLESVSLKPTKANISVRVVALAWTPHWQDRQGKLISAWE
jgi:hypothetical protein